MILAVNNQMAENKELKQIVRIAGFDVDGSKPIYHQLRRVRGVSANYANMICVLIGLQKSKKSGELSDEEIKRIEDAISNPVKYGAPVWMINRRKDPETGAEIHLIGNDLRFVQDNDIKIMKKIRSYRGVRHSLGQPVRGQKTKSNFRKNKGKVQGVVKGKNKPGAGAEKKE
jgi:small subunit ribosomal protein S13